MDYIISAGSTSQSIQVHFMQDSSGSAGEPKTGLLHNTSGLTIKYRRPGATESTISLVALDGTPALDDTWTSGGFLEASLGQYRLDLPDAAVASGADHVVVYGSGTDCDMVPVVITLNVASASNIADQVWDEATSGHTTAGTFGAQCATDIDAILADTNELQTDDVPGLIAALNDVSSADVNAACDTALTDYDAATGAEVAALNDLSAAEVNAEVVDALATDTYAELTSVPAATASLTTMVRHMYIVMRNALDQTATTTQIMQDDGTTPYAVRTVADDGTNFTATEMADPP